MKNKQMDVSEITTCKEDVLLIVNQIKFKNDRRKKDRIFMKRWRTCVIWLALPIYLFFPCDSDWIYKDTTNLEFLMESTKECRKEK